MPNYQSTRQPVAQQKNVNYLSKDFDSIKRDLIDYLKDIIQMTIKISTKPLVVWLS